MSDTERVGPSGEIHPWNGATPQAVRIATDIQRERRAYMTIEQIEAVIEKGALAIDAHTAAKDSEIAELKERCESLENRRGDECDKCGGWVCPPLRCAACMIDTPIMSSTERGAAQLARDAIRKQDSEIAALRAENRELISQFQRLQPAGSPPPLAGLELAKWIRSEVGKELLALRAQVEALKAARKAYAYGYKVGDGPQESVAADAILNADARCRELGVTVDME